MDIVVLLILVGCIFFQIYANKKENKSLKKVLDALTYIVSCFIIFRIVMKIIGMIFN